MSDATREKIRGLISRLKLMDSGQGNQGEIEQTTKEIEDLFLQYGVEEKVNLQDKNLLERTIATLQVIENNQQIEEGSLKEDVPKSDLNKLRIDELVQAYDKATIEDKQKIKDIIARIKNVSRTEVERIILRQQEIARVKKLVEKVDLGKINENKIIKEIAKKEKIDKAEAREILDEVKIIKAKEVVGKFAQEVVRDSEAPEYGNLIKEEIRQVVVGEKAEFKFPSAIDPIKAKTIEKQTENFIKTHPETVRQNFLGEIKEQFDLAKANAPTEIERTQIADYEKLLIQFHNVRSPQILMHQSRKEVETKLQTEKNLGAGKINNAIYDVDTTLKAAYHSPKDFGEMMERAKGLANVSRKLFPNSAVVRSFDNLMANAAKNPIIVKMQRMANVKVEMISFATKIPGVNTLLVGAGEIAGFAAAKDFIFLATEVMAEQGIIPGAIAIFKALTTGAGVLDGAAGVEGITTLSGMLGAFQGIPVLGQVMIVVAMVIMAAWWVLDNIIKPLYNSVNGFLKEHFNINLGGVRDFLANDLNLGGFIGGLGQMAFTAGGFVMAGLGFIFGPMITMGLMGLTAIITPVILTLVGIFLGYQFFVTQPMISSLVPPPQATGGTCVPKDNVGSDGTINCNQNAPESNSGIDKANFVRLANQWHSGKNYAEECFNDVVNRALCAGVNPQFALWAWLHESGASNYSINNVQDFGINNQSVASKDFNEQISYFLKLNPGTACPDLGYWLSFATNYLTGECNPKTEVPQADGSVMTGEKYLKELQDQWNWIKEGNLPDSIKVESGGSQCKGDKTGLADNEYRRNDGTVMVCDGPVDSQGNFVGQQGDSAYDPNAPGLEGIKVEGECSVADHVVDTKQCGQSWSDMGLPGGQGTICSAGCGPTSVSSLIRKINGSMTPNSVIFENGSEYAGMNGSGSDFGQATRTLEKWFPGKVTNNSATQSCDQKYVAAQVCQGKAVMILTYSDNGRGGAIGHFLIAMGVSNGNILVMDPYYDNKTPFVTKGKGNIKELRGCITIKVK